MSSPIHRYVHSVSKWEVYPRPYYFRGRFRDFKRRFERVLKQLPDDVRDEQLTTCINSLEDFLDKDISVLVLGECDLSLEELFISVQSVEENRNVPEISCADVMIFYTKVDNLGDKAVEEISQGFEYLHKYGTRQDIWADSFIVAYNTKEPTSEEEMVHFREQIRLKAEVTLGWPLDNANIIISSGDCDVKYRVSYIYERRIIKVFLQIRSFLGLFVRNSRQIKQTLIAISKTSPMPLAITQYLRNGYNFSDISCEENSRKSFLNQLISRLARHARCTTIAFVSSKYTLPAWFCTRLLNAIEFEDVLIKSVSNKTRYLLCKLKQSYKYGNLVLQNVTFSSTWFESRSLTSTSGSEFDFIRCFIQKDFKKASSEAEEQISSMKSLSTTIGKMIYEIDGYLKQTIVQHNNLTHRDTDVAIPVGLRRSIMAIHGVYGMGTIYGVIEIHLDENCIEESSEFATLSNRLSTLMRKYHLQNSYRIKRIKHWTS